MNIAPINNNYINIYYPKASNHKRTSFKSNRAHEEMMRQIAEREKERERERAKQDFQQEYQKKLDKVDNLAQFALNFASAIKNASDHNLKEFFGTEEEAKDLRSNLSPECQKNSIKLREHIQNCEEFKDPVLSLMTANKLKEFVSDEDVLSDNQVKEVIEATKECFASAIENSDKTKFNTTEKTLINKLKNIIASSDGLDFGKEYDDCLKQLIHLCDMRKKNINTVYNTNLVKNIIKHKI